MSSANQQKSRKAAKPTAPELSTTVVEEIAQVDNVPEAAEPVLVHEEGGSLGESLYKAIFNGASVDLIVRDLLRIYSEGNTDAVCCAVLNLVGKTSGAVQAELDGDSLKDNVDLTTVLEEIYARVPEDAVMYPLEQKDLKYRAFRTAYCRFFGRLVELCYNANIILDGFFLPTLLRWLIAMSESKARCFRHTSIAALLSVLGAINGLIRDLNSRLPSRGKYKKEQVGVLQESTQALVELRNHVISQAIHQRPRDVAPEIRLLVFEHLKSWILKYDEEFAENKYFRYFGMALYDKRPEIRAEALTMIQKVLVATSDNKNRIFLFLQYFAKRLVEMCGDVNMRCAELAIDVIVLILRVYSDESEGKEILDNEMIDSALMTLFDERPTIRHKAGVLLGVFIDSRVPEEISDSAAHQKAAMELLCAFAMTLRSQYNEVMPERYLIDALYTPPQDLPPLLQGYGPMLDFVMSDDAAEAVVGLGLVAAFLEKLRGSLDLGPIPKEDRRRGLVKKLPSNKQDIINAMVTSLSRDVGMLLPSVLEKHRGDVLILCGVSAVIAAVDLNVFTSVEQVARINMLLMLMRKLTAVVPYCEEVHIGQITSAWLALVEDHPLKTEARGQMQELLKQVFKQLFALQNTSTESEDTKNENELLHVWSRICILSSLVSMVDQWGLLKAAFVQHTDVNTTPELLRLILTTLFRCVLWQISSERQTVEICSQMIGEFLTCIFQLWRVNFEKKSETFITLLVDSMVYLCDLCALRHYTMSQMEQDVLVEKFGELSSLLSTEVREAKERYKNAESHFRDGVSLSEIVQFRREVSHLEASQLRITTGVIRLLALNRLSEDVTPRIFLQWLYAPSKTISDVFRFLFRTLRDRNNDSFSLEKSILISAYNHSSEALYQMGLKLSSMHWPLPDKYYAACVSIVRFGMDFATTTGAAMLQAVVAYCPKLLRSDALSLAQSIEANEVLTTSTDPNVQLFVSAIRRAARLDVAGGVSSLRNLKRLRGEGTLKSVKEGDMLTVTQLHQQEGAEEEKEKEKEGGLVFMPTKATPKTRSRHRAAARTEVTLNHVLTEDGWRVRPTCEELASSVASSVSESIGATRVRQTRGLKQPSVTTLTPLPTATQETVLSSLAAELDYNEVFIATQEYD